MTVDMKELRDKLNMMVNDHYSTAEMLRFFSFPVTLPKANVLFIHTLHFNMNRRNCWGFVQGNCPPDVKKLVWEHEKDELYCDPRFGGDHHSAALAKAMKMSGLSADELYTAELLPGCYAAFCAWLNLAKHSSWLRAFSGSTILERANNNVIVKGGGVSVRDYARFTDEVIKLVGQVKGHDVHNVADEEHSDMMEEVLDRYVKTEEEARDVLLGAKDSLAFDRAYRGALGVHLERIHD
jgi:hypothetical protein